MKNPMFNRVFDSKKAHSAGRAGLRWHRRRIRPAPTPAPEIKRFFKRNQTFLIRSGARAAFTPDEGPNRTTIVYRRRGGVNHAAGGSLAAGDGAGAGR